MKIGKAFVSFLSDSSVIYSLITVKYIREQLLFVYLNI